MQPVITLQNPNHDFGKSSLKKQVLFGVNLESWTGEIVIMTGLSGSGKTLYCACNWIQDYLQTSKEVEESVCG